MASQSLYRKWRSQTFDDLIGQEPIIRTLKNALSSGNPAHAYLFTGPRGTGKTSTARLLAKAINCSNPQDGEPCNQCQQCREITAGNSFNVIEIDAASNRGIDSIRDLREKVMMPPSTGKYKVYVLDEAHMLTTEAFNALLKTLEEPPGYAIFVLATTDVHKMLPTVLSRCQRFDFKRITTRQIVERLHFVAEQEHVTLERPAADLIARAAAGGMRDALSLLDQAIAYCGEEISLPQVQSMLGVADPRAINKLISSVAQLDSSAGLHLISELSEAGADLRQINSQVVEYWRALMLAKVGADIIAILDLTEDESSEIRQMTQHFKLEELTECARLTAQNELLQKNQGMPQLGLELAFLECVDLHRRTQSNQISSAAIASHPTVQSSRTTTQAPVPAVVFQEEVTTNAKTRAILDSSTYKVSPQKEQAEISSSSAAAEERSVVSTPANGNNAALSGTPSAEQDAVHPSLTLQQVQDAWNKVKKRVRSKNASTGAMLEHCQVAAVESSADHTTVILQTSREPLYKNLSSADRLQTIEWALHLEFGQHCRVRLLSPGQALPSSPTRDTSSYSTLTVTPQQSAHLERPLPVQPASPPVGEREQADQSVQESKSVRTRPVDSGPPLDGLNLASALPLARTSIVRENTTSEKSSPGVSPETLEQKALRDPIVQEVMKTFMAKIVEVRQK